MNENFTISVLIPTKNRKILLERVLKSVLDQTVLPDEIVVINDESIDGTKEYLDNLSQKHNILKIIHREEGGGVNTARNQGTREAKSDWIAWLDDDDEFVPEAIEKIKQKLQRISDNIFVVNFNSKIYKNDDSFNGGYQFKEDREFIDLNYEDWMLIKNNLKGDCKPVFRKYLFEDKNYLFPETVNGFESYTMNLIAKNKKGIRCYSEVTTLIHQETEVGDRLSLSASAKNPWPLFVLHFKQLFQHYKFYAKHPRILWRKKIEMLKLLARSVIYLIKMFYRKILRFIGMQRWLRLGLRYRLVLKKKYEDLDFNVSFFGYRYRGNLKDYIDRYVFYFGAYEREELLYLKKFLNKNSVVLDIGANTGHHSLFFSRFARQVYAFEPYDKLFYKLSHRMEQNGVKNVEAYNFGLGKENKESEFFASRGTNEGVGSFIPSSDKVAIGKLVVKNGDEFASNLKEKIDFIKIDVEGMETEVLVGLKQTIKKNKPVLFVEMTPEAQAELDGEITELYNIYIIEANNPFLFVFNKLGCKLKKFEPDLKTVNILFIPRNLHGKFK